MENNKLNIKQLYYDSVDYDVESELSNITLACKICNLTLHVETFTYQMIDAHRFDYKFDEATRTLEFICKWCLDPSHNSGILKFHGIYNEVWKPGELTRKIRIARKELNKVDALYNDDIKRNYSCDCKRHTSLDFMDPEVDEDA